MKKIIINESKNLGLVKTIKSNGAIEYVIATEIKKTNDNKIDYWLSGSYFGNDFKTACETYFKRLERNY